MSGFVTPFAATSNFLCLSGFVRRAEPIGIIQRGTHRLISSDGRVIASLSSNTVDLFRLEGQFVTVCGVNEGRIEGVTSLRVTVVIPVTTPSPIIVQPQVDIRLLLLLLFLTQPTLVGGIRPDLLLTLLLSGGLVGSGTPFTTGAGGAI